MPGAEHGDVLAGETVAVFAKNVRHRIGDPRLHLALTDRRQAVRAGRVGRMPRPGRVDHGVGPQRLRALAVLVADFEERLFTTSGLRLVEAVPAHGRDTAGCPDDVLSN